MWDTTGEKTVIFAEGEMDVLSLHEGFRIFLCAVSLPDGAPKTAKFDENDKRFLSPSENCDWLQEAEEVIIAKVDADEAGGGTQAGI